MLAKRFLVVLSFAVVTFSSAALAQTADAAFVVGGSFNSDSTATFVVAPTLISTVQPAHQVILEGAVALRLLNAEVASVSLEVPFAGIPSQTLHLSTAPSTVFAHMSSIYITPGFRLKVAPAAPISPYVCLGGGIARYSLANGSTKKGAIQYGGGVDFKTGFPFLGFRGEVRDFLTGDPNFNLANPVPIGFKPTSNQKGLHRHNILAGGGLVLRF
jgi:hypothetical protein